ncbi:MAG: signal recognition particle protein Srp19 [Candidatus Bathyarchaeota archaeon]|nr:signal recognition particle protein Srp19 [Candidatus Bathyarchaeota archaeon]MDH5786698.1 signal recognition particle protein Srp19 [Candidatus Bathyarchaeota archaeon]
MRKQDKIIIWPTYFDSTKAWKNGRRVSKGLAVPSPRILELKEAAEKLGLENEVVQDAGYPKTPWIKTGMLLVKKNEAKDQIIERIAKQLIKIRSSSSTK